MGTPAPYSRPPISQTRPQSMEHLPPIPVSPDGLLILEPGMTYRQLPAIPLPSAAFTSVKLGGPNPKPERVTPAPPTPDPYAMPPGQAAPW